jgi:hypothetical protein
MNLDSALEEAVSTADDFLTGGSELTIDHIHQLSSKEPISGRRGTRGTQPSDLACLRNCALGPCSRESDGEARW